MLSFLWGIFRGRKSDSLKPHTDLQELCESKIITDPTVQELSPSHTGELSTFQKHDSQKYPPKEFSRGNESSGPSTSGPDDICKTHSFLYKAAGEKESGELSNHNSDLCPRIYSFDLNEICPAVKSNETNLVLFSFTRIHSMAFCTLFFHCCLWDIFTYKNCMFILCDIFLRCMPLSSI